jgi:hypothetical protein
MARRRVLRALPRQSADDRTLEPGRKPAWMGLAVLARGRSCFHAKHELASAAGLTALSRWGRGISGDARCVLADALLLTPLLFR